MKSTICIAEDREACEPCLRLLLLSLSKHCPGAAISLFFPCANDSFLAWIQKYPQVQLRTEHLENRYGWNVKPRAIMHMMDQGFDEVIWIDSDILVHRDILCVFSKLKSDVFVATEDMLGDGHDDRNALRARLWGFPVGRVLPFELNSSVLRVTTNHYHLMEEWWRLLQSSPYQDAQKTAWRERPVHMQSDQDILTALLTSRQFSAIPLHILRRGKDILQFNGVHGYTVAERVRNFLSGPAAFVHSPGSKPWSEPWRSDRSNGLREYTKRIYLDLSPYTLSAIRYRDQLGADAEWMEPHYVASRILRELAMGRPELAGFPIAVLMDFARVAMGIMKSRRPNPSLVDTDKQDALRD